MRTKTIEIYQFDELDDKAKETARRWFRTGNDFDFDWECIVNDAKTIGLKLTNWDYGRYAKGEFILSPGQVANNILKEHGEMCETYKTAKDFLTAYKKMEMDVPVDYGKDFDDDDQTEWPESYQFENEAKELEACFLKSILEDYRIMADNQLDYTNSDEGVDENIIANNYEFTKEGKID